MTDPTTPAGKALLDDDDLCWPDPGPDLRDAILAIEAQAIAPYVAALTEIAEHGGTDCECSYNQASADARALLEGASDHA